MHDTYRAVRLTENVHWVGAIDWGIRDFHGYSTLRGTTYNAYLVRAEKTTLIDTVKAPFTGELLSRIASVIDPKEIDYLVSNHAEMDHSGGLREVMRTIAPEKVFASPMGVKALKAHFGEIHSLEAVENGGTLDLGDRELRFFETRMLHWPDSMFSYLESDRVLFSQDAFGMHLATGERFSDEIPEELLLEEGARYYSNILLPYSRLVAKLLGKVPDLGIDPALIAPDHGPVWRGNLGMILDLYARWAAQRPGDKALIVFDTMWESTARMARAIAEGVVEGGARAMVMPLKATHRSDVAAELIGAGALLVGSPTINNHLFPTVADILTYLAGLKPANLVGAAFGSYGWSGEAVGKIREALDAMKVAPVGEDIKINYVPDGEALDRCRDLGAAVAVKLVANRQ